MDKRLLAILCCPVTHKGLSLAGSEQLRQVNEAIEKGSVKNVDGDTLNAALREALVTDDGKRLYAISDGIPVLLEGQSVLLDQVGSA
ncbi:MAG: Trm112 family protein [Woeseiaceae bacterium]